MNRSCFMTIFQIFLKRDKYLPSYTKYCPNSGVAQVHDFICPCRYALLNCNLSDVILNLLQREVRNWRNTKRTKKILSNNMHIRVPLLSTPRKKRTRKILSNNMYDISIYMEICDYFNTLNALEGRTETKSKYISQQKNIFIEKKTYWVIEIQLKK
ncbi:hypothetical protein H8356DRAFT_1364667 [Neocallimastix lanati (nom. inval.)]|nr:hypothetical protein H8356DRAFT_1364667 [Neocallimastix sp. JGI-2020a]